MLTDEVSEIILRAGKGGAGKVSFFPGFKAGPDGGNGGKGGDLYLVASSDLYLLNQFSRQKEFKAEDGEAGGSNRKTGKDGVDLEIKVPVGTSLTDLDSGEEIELEKVGQRILICKGGLGGRGNWEFRSPRRTTPEYAQPGQIGQEKHFKVVLKLIADFGLIGLPNAGKSSLLDELTNSQARVASYPFTTLEPNLGVMNQGIIADIPGLIEGASGGKGLGIQFLRHIEKVKLLIHCIAADSKDPRKDYNVVERELKQFNQELLEKKQIILLTKSDLVGRKDLEKLMKSLEKAGDKVLSVSIYDWDSLENLKRVLLEYVK